MIATLTIASFVIFFNPNQKGARGGGGLKANFGMVGGRPITREEIIAAQREADLGYFMQNGVWSDDRTARQGFDLRREGYIRIFESEKARQLGIQVSTTAVAEKAREILGAASVDVLMEKALGPRHYTLEDFERFVRHELEKGQLFSAVGLSGKLVTQAEAEDIYRKEHEELSVSLVTFTGSNYLTGITSTPELVASYYTNQQGQYAIPRKRIVSYLKWDETNFLAEAKAALTNLDELITRYYQNGTNGFYKGLKTAEEAKAAVKDDLIKNRSMFGARRTAGAFADELDAKPHTYAAFEALAKEKGLTIKVTEPFDQVDGPLGITGSQKFTAAAFQRTTEEPFSGAIEGEDGFYVLALKSELPSRIPLLAEVEAKVTADFKMNQALTRARTMGTIFSSTVTNGLATGKTFDALASEANSPAKSLPPFSLSTRDLPIDDKTLSFPLLKQIAFSTAPGKASSFIPTADGGAIVFVKAKLPADAAKMKTEMPAFLNYVRQNRMSDSINQWFNKQIEADKAFSEIWHSINEPTQMQSAARRSKS